MIFEKVLENVNWNDYVSKREIILGSWDHPSLSLYRYVTDHERYG